MRQEYDGATTLFVAIAIIVVTFAVFIIFVTVREEIRRDRRLECLGKYTQEQCDWALSTKEGDNK